ncbi:MAG TPA: heme utilization protein, partial [Rubrivivax sp.]|nr:heme utilization protein [Rubrivivax sp.]
VDSLTTLQVSALTTQQVQALGTQDIVALGTEGIVALETQQLVALTTAQYAALTTDQFASLSSGDITAMTTAQAAALTTDQIVAFTTDQIAGLQTADIAAMNADQHAAFATDDIAVMSSAQVDALVIYSPIVLDLDGNGVQTRAAADGVMFDVAGTGTQHKIGWVGGGDALLVRDRNGNGTIDDGGELYGVGTRNAEGQRMGNGYAALALEDSNGDGKVNTDDAHFGELKLWVDANYDGKSDAGELRGLLEMGVLELNLNAFSSDRVDNGNLVALISSYTGTDGRSHEMADVWFAKDVSAGKPAPALNELLVSPQGELLVGGTATPSAATGAVAAAGGTVMHTGSLRGLLDDDRQVPLI